jgi:trans-aconitate methyltransferase
MTLVDRSAAMLAVSRRLNPECQHVEGDMRSVRLVGHRFDGVFIHDALMYMTTEHDLVQAMETCFSHCRPGGASLFVPDYVRETFLPQGLQDPWGREVFLAVKPDN